MDLLGKVKKFGLVVSSGVKWPPVVSSGLGSFQVWSPWFAYSPHIYKLLVTSMSRNLNIYMLLVTRCYATSKTSIFTRVSSPWVHASRTISIYMLSVTLVRVLPHIYMLLVTSMSRTINIYMLLVTRCYATSKTTIFTRVSSPWLHASRTISIYMLSVTLGRVLPHIYMLLVTSMSRTINIYMLLVTRCHATSKTSIFTGVSSPWVHGSRTISIYMFSVTLVRALPHIYMLLVTSMSRNLNIYMLCVTPMSWDIKNTNIYMVYRHPGFGTRCVDLILSGAWIICGTRSNISEPVVRARLFPSLEC